jgi:hypothetical protein
MRTVLPLIVAASLLLLCAGPARAEDDEETRRKEGAALVDQGIALYKAKKFAEALPKFEAAYRLTSAWQVLVHIGMTQRRLRLYQEARESLRRYLREGGDAVPEQNRRLVETELELIRSLLAEVRVTVKLEGTVKVYVDDRLVGSTPLPPILLDPGKYTIRAERAGAVDRVDIEVHAGKAHDVELTPVAPVGFVKIYSSPSGALIRLDGDIIGETPSEREIAAGQHRVRAMLRGYVTQNRDVAVVPGERVEIFFDLDRPWYRKWHYWAGIGAGVAAVTASILIVREINKKNIDYALHYPPNP